MDAPPTRRAAAWPWFLLAGALALWTVVGADGGALPEGHTAPALRLASTAGDFDLEAERGHVVVLAFWATWCDACRAEAPTLSRVHAQLEGAGDRVLGVSVDSLPLASVGDAARRLGMTYPIAVAGPDDVDRFEVDRLPTIYVIAPDGSVARTFTGAVSERTLLDAVAQLRGRRSSGPLQDAIETRPSRSDGRRSRGPIAERWVEP